MGGLVGDKTNMKRIIPEWITEGNKLIKREYLSAFQGGYGSKIYYQMNGTTFKISMGITSQITTPEFEDHTIKYMYQISNMFKDFDINTKVNIKEGIGKDKKIIDL